jgi:hypothetical protein
VLVSWLFRISTVKRHDAGMTRRCCRKITWWTQYRYRGRFPRKHAKRNIKSIDQSRPIKIKNSAGKQEYSIYTICNSRNPAKNVGRGLFSGERHGSLSVLLLLGTKCRLETHACTFHIILTVRKERCLYIRFCYHRACAISLIPVKRLQSRFLHV